MPMALKAAIAIAIIAALIDYFFGALKDPWRKIIYIAAVVLLIVGILQLLGIF